MEWVGGWVGGREGRVGGMVEGEAVSASRTGICEPNICPKYYPHLSSRCSAGFFTTMNAEVILVSALAVALAQTLTLVTHLRFWITSRAADSG